MVARSKRRKQRAIAPAPAPAARKPFSYVFPCALLCCGVFLLYAGSYRYPPVFDDRVLNPAELPAMLSSCASLSNRCVSYSTFGLTYLAAGLDIFWFRAGNVLCHALAALACFLFLDCLFDAVRRRSPDEGDESGAKDRVLAFCGAIWFAAHPVTIYGVAYLVQRSIVMATVFSLLSLTAFTRALSGGTRRWQWLWLSALLYIFAVFSKEHAVMLPAVALAIAILLGERAPGSRTVQAALGVAVVTTAALLTYRLRGYIGTSPEYFTRELGALAAGGSSTFDPAHAYTASVVTQTVLFFKYLVLSLVPRPGWMSADLRQPIASGLFAWPWVLGILAFLAWGIVGGMLLRRRGAPGLLGLGMLFPWLMFFTEFVTARIQEPLVLYRSYLWIAGVPAMLPFLLRRVPARYVVIGFTAITVVFAVAARERLATFASNLALWDDVVRKNTDLSLIFVDRGYGNRAVALLREGRLDEALRDLEMTIKLNPQSSHAYVNRAAVLSKRDDTGSALADLDHAILLDPSFADAHAERCALLIKMNEPARALESCDAALRISAQIPAALLNRAVLHARALRFPSALADLDKVLSYEPGHALALFNRGMIYDNIGRSVEADRDLRASCNAGFRPACDRLRATK